MALNLGRYRGSKFQNPPFYLYFLADTSSAKFVYMHFRYRKYQRFQTTQSSPCSKFFRPKPVARHLFGPSGTDILRLLGHNYTTWTSRHKGLGVPMVNILANAGRYEE